MKDSTDLLVGIATPAGAGAAFLFYRWRQRQRVRRVRAWVTASLAARYGELPDPAPIDCSDGLSWPVLVDFEAPRTGNRHRLQFSCRGPQSTFALLSEKEERRLGAC